MDVDASNEGDALRPTNSVEHERLESIDESLVELVVTDQTSKFHLCERQRRVFECLIEQQYGEIVAAQVPFLFVEPCLI